MMTLSANLLKIHFLEFFLTNHITDWHAIQLILSLCLLYSPYSSHPQICHYPKNAMFSLSLVINNSPMNRFPSIKYQLCPNCPVWKYIPLLCQIWPGFIQKSSYFTNKVLEWYKLCVTIFLRISIFDMMTRSEATVSFSQSYIELNLNKIKFLYTELCSELSNDKANFFDEIGYCRC